MRMKRPARSPPPQRPVSRGAASDRSSSRSSATGHATDSAAEMAEKLVEIKDKLNLAGLLNVLDGVVDTPERLIVMTTNHPEKLDPALIRPGRVDKQIFLGYLQQEEATQMLNHYFNTQVTAAHRRSLEQLLGLGLRITPAQMEQQCAEHLTVGQLLEAFGKGLTRGG